MLGSYERAFKMMKAIFKFFEKALLVLKIFTFEVLTSYFTQVFGFN